MIYWKVLAVYECRNLRMCSVAEVNVKSDLQESGEKRVRFLMWGRSTLCDGYC